MIESEQMFHAYQNAKPGDPAIVSILDPGNEEWTSQQACGLVVSRTLSGDITHCTRVKGHRGLKHVAEGSKYVKGVRSEEGC
jgi:hypothetical protein